MSQLFFNLVLPPFFAVVMIFIIEACGFLGIKSSQFFLRLFSKNSESEEAYSPILNVFVGLLFYGMFIFLLGVLSLLYPSLILVVSAIIPILTFFIFKRYRNILANLKLDFQENKFVYFGVLACGLLLIISIFRPATQFDAVWYHLAIPKYFLQNHNIDYNGELWRYSVHPFLNFFWSVLPLSLPFKTSFSSTVINIFQGILIILALYKVSKVLKEKLKSNAFLQFVTPSLIGLNSLTIFWLGAGYNDLYAFGIGLIIFAYFYHLENKKSVTLLNFAVGLFFIYSLFLLKVFFAFFAAIAFVYLVYLYLKDKPGSVIDNLKSVTVLTISTFVIFILPWIVRSYLWTGRPLDPIGAPGINEDAYNFAGSGTALNHWSVFVWTRLNSSVPSLFINQISVIFGIGFFSIFHPSIRKNFMNLWVLAFASFWVTYFASIVADIRYLLPIISIFVVLGTVILIYFFQESKNLFVKSAMWLPLVIVFGLAFISSYALDGMLRKTYLPYLLKNQGEHSLDAVADKALKGNNLAYYQADFNYLPTGFSFEDKIATYGIHSLGYFENPLFEIMAADRNSVLGLQNFDQFYEILKQEDVKFIALKNSDLLKLCEYIEMQNPSSCMQTEKLKADVFDSQNFVQWYAIN